MNEESIFTEALAKRTPADRAAYLNEVCAGNDALRRQVEELLRSHEEGGNFLEVPAAIQLGLGEDQPADRTKATGDCLPLEPRAAHGPHWDPIGETRVDPRDGDVEDDAALDFLDPSPEPGYLGRLGHYEVKEVVGQGGMGLVLRAFDTKLHRVVAIKVMAAKLAASATARRRFSREAQAAAAVCHEHVVTIHAVDDEHRPPYLVMQFVEGVSLQQKLDREGALGLRQILRIGLQAAEGLAAAHKQGLVHRDIKPANILLENGVERVKITDFGLARAAEDASLTQSGMIVGTPQYMSPEQADGEAVDQRSDLFSLGSVLYAACTGVPPFAASSNAVVLKRVVEDTPRPIREINPDVPEWLCGLIAGLHAKDPTRRPASAGDVAGVFASHLAELQHPTRSAFADETELKSHQAASQYAPRAIFVAPLFQQRPSRFVLAAAAALASLIGLGLCELTGLTHLGSAIGRLIRPGGTLVLECEDPGLSVVIDDGAAIKPGAGVHEFRLRAGSHILRASKGDVVLRRETVEIEAAGRTFVHVPAREAPRSTYLAAGSDHWANSVLQLPAQEQVQVVSARLKELNPNFDGRVDAGYKDGAVDDLYLCTDNVSDISPIRALRTLRRLSAKGSEDHRWRLSPRPDWNRNWTGLDDDHRWRLEYKGSDNHLGGKLADLTPLRGLKNLAALDISNNRVQSLDVLEGIRLVFINLGCNPIHDLQPLSGMPLGMVWLYHTDVADLSPLAGMHLSNLILTDTPVRDLSPLKGAPLEYMSIGYTLVTDLSPLNGLSLKHVEIFETMIKSLEPLRGARLTTLRYEGTPIPEISVLKGMPLELVTCDFQPARDVAVLRSIPTLKTINHMPATAFWKNFDARQAGVEPN